MNFDRLKEHVPKICDYKECKEFAVLIPIVEQNGEQCIAFQVRSKQLIKQPSEVCFPGGSIECDENPFQAAIRETSEELLVNQESIEIIGKLDTLVTPFNMVIYAFPAYIHNYQGTFSESEVEEIFYVPLEFLKYYEPHCSFLDVIMKPHNDFPFDKVQLGREYPWAKGTYPVYFYEYKDRIIWGITARILRNFIEIINC